MKLPGAIPPIVTRARAATRLVGLRASNVDALMRVPTPSAFVRAVSAANAASVSATETEVETETPASALPPVGAPPAADERTVLRFPVAAGETGAPLDGAQMPPVVYSHQGEQVAVLKAGQQSASWSNPFVSHALPAILQLQRHLASAPRDQSALRAQLGLEVRCYRERLASSGCEWQQIQDASYLLCTYLDERVNDAARAASLTPYDGERSLLVEFHDDAWGGEDAFSDLARWMKTAPPPVALLSFYELILSLGWQGRYRVLDRGGVLLQDLRSQLHAAIWHHVAPEPLGTPLVAPARRRRSRWTPAWANAVAIGAVLLAYAIVSAMLNSQGRPIRHALAAWMPPTRAINLAETLPPPLPQLLAEGWLTAYRHPQGWLLVFRSDGAFDTGKAEMRADFRHNIERLGLAFAPWPGDLEVIGHTDRQPVRAGGVYADNQALSEARARTVADELRSTASPHGARAPGDAMERRIGYSGRGDTQPVDPAMTPAAFERNRRVTVLWKVVPADASVTPYRRGAARPAMPDGVTIAPDGQWPQETE